MRQDDRVHLRVRQVVCPPEDMADLVVDPAPGDREGGPGEVGTRENLCPAVDIARLGDDAGQAAGEDPDSVLGHQRRDRIGALGVEGLGAMGHRIHPRRPGYLGRQAEGQQRVVDDRSRLDRGVATRLLASATGEAPDRGHLRPGIRRGNGDNRDGTLERNGLAEARGRAAPDSDDGIRVAVSSEPPGSLGVRDRHMRADLRNRADDALTESCPKLVRPLPARAIGDEHDPLPAQAVDLVWNPGEDTLAEHDPPGQGVVRERRHRHLPVLIS